MTERIRGKYIVIEGHDATGKSTQVRALADHLATKGIDSLIIEEPGSDDPTHALPIANRIREVIKDGSLDKDGMTNLLLFTAARHELTTQRIEPALQLGKWVLAARNWMSSLAYQGHGEGLDLDLIEQTTRTFTSETYFHPDATILLLMKDEQERKRRITARGELQTTPDTFEARDDNFQGRVHAGYSAIAQRYDLPVITASQPINAVTRDIRRILDL